MSIPAGATWPSSEIERALTALAREAGLSARAAAPRAAGERLDTDESSRAVELTARWLGLEAEAVDGTYAHVERIVRGAGPALLRLELDGEVRLAALVRAGRRRAALACPDGLHRIATAALCAAMRRPLEAPVAAAVDRTLERTRVPRSRRARAREGLMLERLGGRRFGGCWILRRPASAPFAAQLRAAGTFKDLAALVGSHLAQYGLGLSAWWCLARGALEGHLDHGWLLAWAALLVTQVPFRLLELRAQGRIAIEAAALLKRRLFQGSLALAPEEMRGEGAGQLLGRTLEANVVESMAVTSGLAAVLASVDLVVAGVVLTLGAGGVLSTVAMAVWVALGSLAARRYLEGRRAWTDERLTLTHNLVERMLGHRTRVAQEPREEWHAGEDAELSAYLARSRELDRSSVLLTAILPAGWLVVGLATLAPAILSGTTSTAALAVGIGGAVLAFGAMRKLGEGARNAATVAIAWDRIAPLFEAGGRSEPPPPPEPARRHSGDRAPDQALLVANELVFRYRAGGEPILRHCTARVAARDRVLLEGPSGGGKSTLSLVLAGVRLPESGTLLLDGLDRHTMGSGEWRRRVVTVPQFHENHVFSSTFAFNLLMGRGWPPLAGELEEAEAVCRELGLGELLERMPAGLQQMVGETGWQLSHGERSRLYVARALLQTPALLVLDESFAALDPETMKLAMECVLRRAQALVVVAHP